MNQWLAMLDNECDFVTKQWAEIAPSDFGRPPCLQKKKVFVQAAPNAAYVPYDSTNHRLQMQMPQEKVLKLLEGTNIYDDQYVGIRELVQNAVDASLLQMWYDLTHNKYAYLIQKNQINARENHIGITDIPQEIFRFYDILVELIRDYKEKKIYVVIKDKGIGIDKGDIEFMANIGESKEKNKRIRKIMRNMPEWLKPAGIFGIGLQSVFQLTDAIEFYSRRPNQPERKIVFYSMGKNRGRIEVRDLHEEENHIFYDNYMQGTNVKFAVNCDKLWENKDKFLYYDPHFDEDSKFEAVFVEMAHVITAKLSQNPFDYFNVHFQTMTLSEAGEDKQLLRCPEYCFFNPQLNETKFGRYRLSILPFMNSDVVKTDQGDLFAFNGINRSIYYFDQTNFIYYRLDIFPCICIRKETDQGNLSFALPQSNMRPVRVWYKFNEITEIDAIFDKTALEFGSPACSSLVNMQIIIFDSPANNYLNIDRKHLKEQEKLTPQTIEDVQKIMIGELCKRLVTEKDNKRLAAFAEEKEMAVSLLLLFYQYAEEKSISDYWELLENKVKRIREKEDRIKEEERKKDKSDIPEQGKLLKEKERLAREKVFDFNENWTLVMGEAYLPIKYLKKCSSEFMIKYRIPFPMPVDGCVDPDAAALSCRKVEKQYGFAFVEDIEKYMPLKYFHIKSIETVLEHGSAYLWYKVALRRSLCQREEERIRKENIGISMDEGARLIDYRKLFSSFSDNRSVDYESLLKKVMKPDLAYGELLVYRRPRSFQYGQNMINGLEYGIDAFILSPFDSQTAKMVRKYVMNEEYTEVWIFEAMKSSSHFKKCVDYIVKFHYSNMGGVGEGEKLRPNIIQAYEKFVKNFCITVKKHQKWMEELVLKEFKDK